MIPWMVFKLVADDDLNIHFIQDIMAGKCIYIIALLWYETKYCLHLSIILISQYNINVVCNFLNLPTCSDKYPLLFLQYCHSLYTEAFGQRYYDIFYLKVLAFMKCFHEISKHHDINCVFWYRKSQHYFKSISLNRNKAAKQYFVMYLQCKSELFLTSSENILQIWGSETLQQFILLESK